MGEIGHLFCAASPVSSCPFCFFFSIAATVIDNPVYKMNVVVSAVHAQLQHCTCKLVTVPWTLLSDKRRFIN